MPVQCPTNLPESSWLSDACASRKDPESEWLARGNPETNWITIKPETVSHVAERSSWVPLPFCPLPGGPFPIKSLALSAHVSPQTIYFRVLDRSPLLGSGRDLSSATQRVWDTLGERSNSQGTWESGAHGRGQSWRHNLEMNRRWMLKPKNSAFVHWSKNWISEIEFQWNTKE